MSEYYKKEDLARFAEVGRNAPELFKKFMAWYAEATGPGGLLTKKEKALVCLGVALAIQCPYCIDAYTQAALEEGMSMEHITEAAHAASALRGGASLIHTLQAKNAADDLFM